MGVKEYEFLILTRNQILSTEEKITRIDERLLSIEEEITDLRQEKRKLKLPKSENWKEELDSEYQSQSRKFEEFKHSKLSELKSLEKRIVSSEKQFNFWVWSTIILFSVVFVIMAILEGSKFIFGNYFDWSDSWVLFPAQFLGLYFIVALVMIVINLEKSPSPRNHEDFSDHTIIRREDVSRKIESLDYKNKESFLGDVNKKKRSFSRAVNRDKRIDDIINALEDEITEIIQQKENCAKEIKIKWESVSHLIPKSD